LNTLFSISGAKTNLDLAGLLAILNSRFMSATYERWANRLFGDKFPKVSKLDLARLPVPATTRAQARQLSEWGSLLQRGWTQLKQLTVDLDLAISLADASGRLSKDMTRFWELSKPAAIQAISRVLIHHEDSLKLRDTLLRRWAEAKAGIEAEWSKVASVEAEAEEFVSKLYGVKPEIYAKVIQRSPLPSLDDVLLPSR
jgi:hypothetical protein